ncbi:TetR/AcrR family transcriptional regulator [Phenylobacterium sp.]|uniref:TetR/AcrR family transcriptional regulator n=1 Tax=Phenylobacterium sp. TaxID=1871053 RepID=UPI00272147A1|nr:TetR/AcrR family transcriptional regulator [Phenylobacterium sp.]MDO8377958.1 TetR/AcrR family transcriptional regulator [Phenylobacterium sp.]
MSQGVELQEKVTRGPTRRFEQRKSAIVSSAVEVLNRKGVRGMTLGEVAARLNLVPTGVIYYFRNKEDLAAACFLQGIARFNALLAAGRAGADVRTRLTLFLDAYFDYRHRAVLGEAEPIAVFNDVRALKSEPVNAAYVDMFRSARSLLSGPETAGLTRLALNARTHMLVSEIFWTVAWLHRHDPEDYGRVSQRILSIAADGLAAPGAVWNPQPLPDLIPEPPAGGEISSELFLRAATELINEEGYLGASVEKISARLNVTKGAFYHHNETKDELVAACFERTVEVMRRAIRQAEAVSATGLQTLATVAAALVAYQMSGNAPLLRTSALTSAPESIQPQLVAKFDRISDRFASLISDGIADGSLRAVDTNIGAQMITAMINAAADLHYWAPAASPEMAVSLYVRPFFEGLLSAPAP